MTAAERGSEWRARDSKQRLLPTPSTHCPIPGHWALTGEQAHFCEGIFSTRGLIRSWGSRTSRPFGCRGSKLFDTLLCVQRFKSSPACSLFLKRSQAPRVWIPTPPEHFQALPSSMGVRTIPQAGICVNASNSRGQPIRAWMLERNVARGVKWPHVERFLLDLCSNGGCRAGEGHGHTGAKLVALCKPQQ